jgi:hypothetical protein
MSKPRTRTDHLSTNTQTALTEHGTLHHSLTHSLNLTELSDQLSSLNK